MSFVVGAALVLAPALFALSSFFWTGDGEYGVAGGTALMFGSVFWIVGLAGVFRTIEPVAPRYAAWGFLAAVYGDPVVANLIFWIGGPAFPLSLVVLGIVLARTGLTPVWVGLMLATGGLLFPVARIPRIALIAHAVDVLMLVPAAFMGLNLLRGHSIGGPRRHIH